ncbi:Disintegrin and metalloproteinase domain-containing protein 10 [Eumeta japonica]|uniref:Disintegrin and metalloproteinase domain-containing protein 10 n=1 Tax=Eumeta variegata TaxID=151549 RepID=A0A4C1T963_EUMVA|nr:Disintegrin and metalloproteinase domain-containing protein 10 [Eumeta japonica]
MLYIQASIVLSRVKSLTVKSQIDELNCTKLTASRRRRLNEYIDHYDPLEYDCAAVHGQHARLRRSTDPHPPDLRIDFRAHGRHFKLRLRRDLSAFGRDFKVEGSNGELHDVDTSHIYHGEIIGRRSRTGEILAAFTCSSPYPAVRRELKRRYLTEDKDSIVCLAPGEKI